MDDLKNQWTDINYWKSICPSLQIPSNDDNEGDAKKSSPETYGNGNGNDIENGKEDMAVTDARNGLLTDGYALIDADSIEQRTTLTFLNNRNTSTNQQEQTTTSKNLKYALKTGIEALTEANIPATFILLFDETWELAHGARTFLSEATHAQNQLNFDILAWFIDPRRGESGFSPHRDRQPDDIASSFHKPYSRASAKIMNGANNVNAGNKRCADATKEQTSRTIEDYGMAKYVTMWMALSNATPENSCLYVIPAGSDPGYYAGDPVDKNQPDPLQRALRNKNDYQNIRALPRRSGESVVFTHRIMHWGSKGNIRCNEPRVAISFVVSSGDFERPYVDPSYFTGNTLPPFHVRLLLVCAQLLIYHQRFNLSSLVIRTCFDYCKEHQSILDPSYFKKVNFEFIGAMKESKMITTIPSKQQGDLNGNNCDEDNVHDDDADDDEDEEAILEAMLDADAEGHDMEDDFDDLECGDEEEGFDDDNDDDVGECDDDYSSDNEGPGILFGSRPQPQKKRAKRE
mmetsp:Transcript_21832/g.32688  ORF Transcript_21832/g.32688 Transcript_21832/m.32688 type:complete len:516 (-) Transcript_21832:170-1717(-)